MRPLSLPNNCQKVYCKRLKTMKSCRKELHGKCNSDKSCLKGCDLWDEMTAQEKSDAAVIYRIENSWYYPPYTPASESDMKRFQEIIQNNL